MGRHQDIMELDLPLREQHSRGMWMKAGVLAGIVGLAGFAAGAALSSQRSEQSTLDLQTVQQKEERVTIVPSYASCSGPKDNCFETGCCKTSGHTCFVKSPKIGQCNETCTPGVKGFSCGVASNAIQSVPAAGNPGTSLYCISAYTKNTGSPKVSHELELLQSQHKFGASLFGCEAWDVFSDVSVPVGPGYTTVKVEDVNNEFHQVKRKETGAWVNWALFYQVWLKVRDLGKWQGAGWTVKVDADAVFIPQRLREFVSNQRDTPHGVYFENCKDVQYGYFGNLEVMSKTAAGVLTDQLEECHTQFAPCANDGCDWKFGSWGEDVFVQRCLDHHYVDKAEAFDMTTDGACKADRPEGEKKNKKWHAEDCSQATSVSVHPFKKPQEYFKCLGQIMQSQYEV